MPSQNTGASSGGGSAGAWCKGKATVTAVQRPRGALASTPGGQVCPGSSVQSQKGFSGWSAQCPLWLQQARSTPDMSWASAPAFFFGAPHGNFWGMLPVLLPGGVWHHHPPDVLRLGPRLYASPQRLAVAQDSPFLSVVTGERRLRPSGVVQWVFWVRSDANGRSYMVGCHEGSAHCSCGQFRRNGDQQPCKHLYFLSAQIAGLRDRLAAWQWLVSPTDAVRRRGFDELDRRWVQRFERHMSALESALLTVPDPGREDEDPCCTVCMEPVCRRQRKSHLTCRSCQGVFHKACILPWLIQSDSCPNCRGAMHLTHLYDTSERQHANPLRHARITRDCFESFRGRKVSTAAHRTLCRRIRRAFKRVGRERRPMVLDVGARAAGYAHDYLRRCVYALNSHELTPFEQVSQRRYILTPEAFERAQMWLRAGGGE